MRRALLPVLLLALALPARADLLRGKVVGVADGDTVTVLDDQRAQHRVRLLGIDAPESHQPFGSRAKQNLSAIVFGRQVEVDWKKRDRYGRIVGRVRAPAADCRAADCQAVLDVGLAQVSAGLAWHYKRYKSEQPREDRVSYAAAEEAARTKRTGLWSDTNPEPPWLWRKAR